MRGPPSALIHRGVMTAQSLSRFGHADGRNMKSRLLALNKTKAKPAAQLVSLFMEHKGERPGRAFDLLC